MAEPQRDPYQYERELRERLRQAQQGQRPPQPGPQPPYPGQPRPGQPASAADDLRRSIQELGFSIADEVGKGLRAAAQEVRQEAQKASKAGYNYSYDYNAHVQRARQMSDQLARKAHQKSSSWGESVQSFFCGLGSFFLGLLCFASTVCAIVFSCLFLFGGIVWGLPAGLGCAAGIALFGLPAKWLGGIPARRRRMKRYLAAMGQETVVPVARLAEAVQKPVSYVKKELSKMIRQGWLASAYLDDDENVFFLKAEEYRALQQKQEAAARAAAAQNEPKTAQSELDDLMQQGQDFILLLDEHINATLADPALCGQLRKMRATAADIMTWVSTHPASAPKVKKFARYYMPTTLKLLRTYDDVKGQQSDVATGIRQDIGGILGTLNTAFDNLLADLLNDTALDVSSEISAMQTMLAQDGLTLENLTPKE